MHYNMSADMDALAFIEKVNARTARVGIIGMGYVGLPLAIEFARAGFPTTGFDIDPEKARKISEGRSYIKHIPSESIKGIGLSATTDFNLLGQMDAVIVCVPTPLNRFREPDLSYVLGSTREIAARLRPGQLVVLESTTYPGTTDDEMRPILEAGGLKAGHDFFLAFSPEREDPNNPNFTTATIPKVVGGYTPACLEASKALYGAVVRQVVAVSSTQAAEATKILENIYRAVNIALVNELKVLFDRMGIDVWEVIDAAKTKPFGFQAFYPGPGLGGHCIPIDPFYLTWKAREYDFQTRFIELAGEINTSMPYYVIERLAHALNDRSKSLRGSRVLVMGVAYKKDVDDMRESPSLKLIELLMAAGAEVEYHDPHVPILPRTRKYSFDMKSVELTPETLSGSDCVLIATNHTACDYALVACHARLIVDTRNAMAGFSSDKIVKA